VPALTHKDNEILCYGRHSRVVRRSHEVAHHIDWPPATQHWRVRSVSKGCKRLAGSSKTGKPSARKAASVRYVHYSDYGVAEQSRGIRSEARSYVG
jgi:hypothetical protein